MLNPRKNQKVYSEQRTKEIGIRKVLGATSWGTCGVLTEEFMNLVILSNVIANLIANLVISSLLVGFTYRAGISLGLSLFASLAAGLLLY